MENATQSEANGDITETITLNTTESLRSVGLSDDQLVILWNLYRVSVPVVFAIISFVGIVGNGFALIVCAKNDSMKTIHPSMVSLLAVTDLLFLLTCVPTTAIVYSVPIWPFGVMMCKVTHYLLYTSAYVTIYVMCLMTYERFCVIVCPLGSLGIRSRKSLTYLSIGIIIFSIAANIPVLFIYGIQHGVNNHGEATTFCFHDHYVFFNDNLSLSHLFFMYFVIFVYVIPILVFILTYSAIFYKLNNRKKVSSTETNVSHIRAAKIILALWTSFFVCYTPIHIMYLLEKFTTFFKNQDTYVIGCVVFVAGNVLSYTNSCLKPMLYSVFSSEYRTTLLSLLKGTNVDKPSCLYQK